MGFYAVVATGNKMSDNKRFYTSPLANDMTAELGHAVGTGSYWPMQEQQGPGKGPIKIGQHASSYQFVRLAYTALTDEVINAELEAFKTTLNLDQTNNLKADGRSKYPYPKTVISLGLMKDGPQPMALYNHFTIEDSVTILRNTIDLPSDIEELLADPDVSETIMTTVFGTTKSKPENLLLFKTAWECF